MTLSLRANAMKAVLAATVLMSGAQALAEPGSTRSKTGIQVQSFGKGSSITNGMMVGFRTVTYLPENSMYYGAELMAGSRMGGRLEDDNLTYGGFTLGYDARLGQIFTVDLSLMGGYGYGRVTAENISGHGIMLQPTIAVGLNSLEGYRATFAVGYLRSVGAPGLSGVTFGIRLERKSLDFPRGLVD